MEKKNIWFKAKKYGWGWQPVSFEGWLVTIIWVVINVRSFFIIDSTSGSGSDTLISFSFIFIVTTILFLTICYKKGETPGWRWGEPRD